jgi:hypothetical protein
MDDLAPYCSHGVARTRHAHPVKQSKPIRGKSDDEVVPRVVSIVQRQMKGLHRSARRIRPYECGERLTVPSFHVPFV